MGEECISILMTHHFRAVHLNMFANSVPTDSARQLANSSTRQLHQLRHQLTISPTEPPRPPHPPHLSLFSHSTDQREEEHHSPAAPIEQHRSQPQGRQWSRRSQRERGRECAEGEAPAASPVEQRLLPGGEAAGGPGVVLARDDGRAGGSQKPQAVRGGRRERRAHAAARPRGAAPVARAAVAAAAAVTGTGTGTRVGIPGTAVAARVGLRRGIGLPKRTRRA